MAGDAHWMRYFNDKTFKKVRENTTLSAEKSKDYLWRYITYNITELLREHEKK